MNGWRLYWLEWRVNFSGNVCACCFCLYCRNCVFTLYWWFFVFKCYWNYLIYCFIYMYSLFVVIDWFFIRKLRAYGLSYQFTLQICTLVDYFSVKFAFLFWIVNSVDFKFFDGEKKKKRFVLFCILFWIYLHVMLALVFLFVPLI